MIQLFRDLWRAGRYLWACRRLDKVEGDEEDVLLSELDTIWYGGNARSVRFIQVALEVRNIRKFVRVGFDS